MRSKKCMVFLMIFVLCISFLAGCGSADNNQSNIAPENSQEITQGAATDEDVAEESTAIVEESANSTEETMQQHDAEGTTESVNNEITIDPEKPMIAITFDDGPNLVTTPQVLDLLEEYNVRATFFVIGDNINLNTMSVITRTHEMGCEIANHSKTHSDMTAFSADVIADEIKSTSDKVENIIGVPTKFFRPPYISVNDTMYENIDMPFICGYGCNDWVDSVTAEERSESVLKQAKDGAIILLHDFTGNSQTVEALKTIIPALLDEGYQFVTVSELFEAKGVEVSADDTNLYSVVE